VGSATLSGRALLGCCGSEDCVLPYWLRSRVAKAAAGRWRDGREVWCAYRRAPTWINTDLGTKDLFTRTGGGGGSPAISLHGHTGRMALMNCVASDM
jgi:hypothetical protein